MSSVEDLDLDTSRIDPDVASRRLSDGCASAYRCPVSVTTGTARRLPPVAVDALLGVAVTAVVSVVITADQGGRTGPDAVAYLWAAGLGALMLIRRRHPVLVVAITVFGLFAYYAAGYPAVGVAVPVAAALYSAAEFGRLPWAIGGGVVVLATSVAFRLVEGQAFSYVVGYELAGHAALIAGAIALGDGIRSRRRVVADAERIVALTAESARREAEAATQATHLGLARDLHDSIGHSTSVIALHADVAREALERDEPAAAEAALRVIKDTSVSTMTELRRTVGVLRRGVAPSSAPLGVEGIPALLTTLGDLRVTSLLDAEGLPPSVDAAVFRVVQESVTNIVRHAAAREARVEVRADGEHVSVTVTDDGPARPPGPGAGGHGIAGMRERVEALGGSLSAEPTASGFRVAATIPRRERA